MTALVECVPNFSEGRDLSVMRAIAEAAVGTGVRVLDWSGDPDHHRMVLTFGGEPEAVLAAALRAAKAAVARIDLRTHRGVHPRIGAVDVVPFVPIAGVTMADCVALARRFGEQFSRETGAPVYLYGEAATRPERRVLRSLRRGGYEALVERIATAGWEPDFGATRCHTTAGATAVGARPPLIAYNVNLDSANLAIAQAIAHRIRERDGGLPGVQALGLMLQSRGIAQVSTNLLDYTRTPLSRLYETIHQEAALRGARPLESEIVGLAPLDALLEIAAGAIRLPGVVRERVLDLKLM